MQEGFETIGEIFGNSVFGTADFSRISKQITLFSFWGNVVGEKFIKNSKPYSYKFKKLFVSCKNSFVAQELLMYKKEILKKASVYANALELEIKDIVFEYKNWREEKKDTQIDESLNFYYDKNDLEKIQLNEVEISSIKENIDRIDFLNEIQKEKYLNDILNNLKVQKIKQGNN